MKKNILIVLGILIVGIVVFIMIENNKNENKIIETSSGEVLSNKKIGWGIKRNDNHEQPDLGSANKKRKGGV